jgi:hypothetical protein
MSLRNAVFVFVEADDVRFKQLERLNGIARVYQPFESFISNVSESPDLQIGGF